MAEQDKAAKDLASAIEAGQDTHLGTSNRSAKPGQSVRVTLGGNMGAIDAIAGTPLSPGQTTAVGFSESGEAIAAAPGGSVVLGKETVIKERSQRQKTRKLSEWREQENICPILVSEIIKKPLDTPPDCACDTWRVYVSASGAKIPYKACAPGFNEQSYPEEPESFQTKVWGIHEKFSPPSGGIGFPWVSEATCAYPQPWLYGYELEFLFNQGLNGYSEHSFFGISAGIVAVTGKDILRIADIFEALNVIIFPQANTDVGVAKIFTPNGLPTSELKWMGFLSGYRRRGFFLEGYVASSNTMPPGFTWWRTSINYVFADGFNAGGALEQFAQFKDQFPSGTDSTGRRLYYYCELRRIFKESEWAVVRDTSICPPPPELKGEEPGSPPGEEGPDGRFRYFLTKYKIAGLTPEPFLLPFECRADDPTLGQISLADDTIYVSIHRGGKESLKQTEKEQPLKNAGELLQSRESVQSGSAFRPISGGNADQNYAYPDDLFSQSNGKSYIYSWRIAQVLSHSMSACEIYLYAISIKTDEKGNHTLTLVSADTYKNGEVIPINPQNWKADYMTSFLVGYCIENSGNHRNIQNTNYRDLLMFADRYQSQKEVLSDIYGDAPALITCWPNITIDFAYKGISFNTLLNIEKYKPGESNKASSYYSFLKRLKISTSWLVDTAAKGLNFRTINLENTHVQVLGRTGESTFDGRFYNTIFMPLVGYVIADDYYSRDDILRYYKRQAPTWLGSNTTLSPFSTSVPSDAQKDRLIERYYSDRINLAANLVKTNLYIIHFEQVDHIEEGDSEEVKAQKRVEFQHELKYLLIKGRIGKKVKAKLKVLDCSTPLPNIENLAAPPEGVKIKEVDAQIYPLGWVEGETMALTIWGAAPGPAPKPKK